MVHTLFSCMATRRLHGCGSLGEQAKLVANDATVVVLTNTGHWVLEENQQETMDALVKFL
jgi:pimeloyl-ACP methyl ester carboxylesterase